MCPSRRSKISRVLEVFLSQFSVWSCQLQGVFWMVCKRTKPWDDGRSVPVFCSRGMFGLLGAISFKGKSGKIMKECAQGRGHPVESGTDVLGRGKDIKRSTRDYVCSKRFGTMTASKHLLTENRLSQTTILRIAFGAPRHLKRPLPWEFSSQGKTIGKKVGDVQTFTAAASSSLRKSQGFVEPKTGVSPGKTAPSSRSLYSFKVFT